MKNFVALFVLSLGLYGCSGESGIPEGAITCQEMAKDVLYWVTKSNDGYTDMQLAQELREYRGSIPGYAVGVRGIAVSAAWAPESFSKDPLYFSETLCGKRNPQLLPKLHRPK